MTKLLSSRRRRAGRALFAACAASTLIAAGGGAIVAATTTRPIIAAPITLSGETGFVNGDTLKLTFYETVGSRDEPTSRPALSTMVEDTEMTGEYVIQLDGTIYVPLIGTVKATGLTPEALQLELGAKSAPLFSHPVKMIVKLVKREPIYVTGNVPQAGAFDYRPYMTVMHAMILAGVRTAGPQMADRMDILQQTEHLHKIDAALCGLIARRDALLAGRDGNPPTPSAILVDLVGNNAAERRVADANRLVSLEDAKLRDEIAAFDDGLAGIEDERKILKKSSEDDRSALEQAAERYKFVTSNQSRGIIVQNTVDQAQANLDAARARFNDNRASLARVEEGAITLRQKKTVAIAEAAIARQREIDNLQDSITEAAVTRATFGPTLDFAKASFAHRGGQPTFRILRPTATGMMAFQATEITPVVPGDIVEVTTAERSLSAESPATEAQGKNGASGIPEATTIEVRASGKEQ